MRKILIISLTFCLISLTACKQASVEPPALVKAAFEQKFKDVVNVNWGSENATEWEAEFSLDDVDYTANFNAEGIWLETEYQIPESDVPEAVLQTLENDFTDYEIGESEISETAEGMKYEFLINTLEEEYEVSISSEGLLIKKEVVNTEEEEND